MSASRRGTAAGTLALAFGATGVSAHNGLPLAPHDLPGGWSWDPVAVVGLVSLALLYARGSRALRASASGNALRRSYRIAFWSGWWTLAIALVSPLHRMGEALLTAHMVQHELLIAVAAPLLVLGRPLLVALWGLPRRWRRGVGRWLARPAVRRTERALTSPSVAWSLHAVALWAWHVPALYERSLASDLAHAAQHLGFFGTALLFWWALLGPRLRAGAGVAVLYLFATALHTGVLGALLTFSDALWYPAYGDAPRAWGLTPIADQQLAGVVMWVPGGISYLVAGLALTAAWLKESDARLARWERSEAL